MGVYSKSSVMNEASGMDNVLGCGHIMDAIIENTTNDLNMFNAVITLDFAEAYTKLGVDVFMEADGQLALPDKSQEAAKDGIFKRIKDALAKIAQKLIDFAKDMGNKFADLFKTNKKLYEKYEKAFDENVKKKKIRTRKIGTSSKSTVKAQFSHLEKTYEKLDKEIKKAIENERFEDSDVENVIDVEYKEVIDGEEEDAKERLLTTDETTEVKYMMSKGAMKPAIIAYIQSLAKMIKDKDIVIGKKKADAAAANFEFKVTIKAANKIAKDAMKYAREYNSHFALCRKVFLQVARETAEEATDESAALDYMVGMASDIYMESVFAV